MKDQTQSNFRSYGIPVGLGLLILSYGLTAFLYTLINPELYLNSLPHKYSFFLSVVCMSILLIILGFKRNLREELVANANHFPEFKKELPRYLAIEVFGYGSFILLFLGIAYFTTPFEIYEFTERNSYVLTADSPYMTVDWLLLGAFDTIVFQGFLYNGLKAKFGIRNATIITSIIYGFWFTNYVGGFVAGLFLNKVYEESRNIFYPMFLLWIAYLLYITGYIIQPLWFIDKAIYPDYNKNLVKGLAMFFIGLPIAYQVLKSTIRFSNSHTEIVLDEEIAFKDVDDQ